MDDSDTTEQSVSARLLAYLSAEGVEADIIAPGVLMPTVPLAAAAIGVAEQEIIKSVLFRSPDGTSVLAIASGPSRIDRTLLAEITGQSKLKLADPETVLSVTGFPAGGVAPVGFRSPVQVVIDRRAAELEIVYGGGGTEETLLRIRPRDIVRLTHAIIADITQPA